MSFDGVPFSVDKVSILDCQYGVHYWKEKKEKESKKKRLKLQGSRKIGCHAHIRIHAYTLYPDFQLSPDESQGVSKYKLRQIKEEKLQAARETIATGGVKTVQKYFVSLPMEQAHEGHPVGEAASFCQRIHPIILNKISELVSSGIDETKEVQRALNHYVKHTLPIEHNITPIPTDRAFYPLPNDIKNHVHAFVHVLKCVPHQQASVGVSASPQDPQPQTTTPSQKRQPSSTTGTVGQPLRAGKHQ